MARLERVRHLLLPECWRPREQSRLAQFWHRQRIVVGGEFVLLSYLMSLTKPHQSNVDDINMTCKLSWSSILPRSVLRKRIECNLKGNVTEDEGGWAGEMKVGRIYNYLRKVLF